MRRNIFEDSRYHHPIDDVFFLSSIHDSVRERFANCEITAFVASQTGSLKVIATVEGSCVSKCHIIDEEDEVQSIVMKSPVQRLALSADANYLLVNFDFDISIFIIKTRSFLCNTVIPSTLTRTVSEQNSDISSIKSDNESSNIVGVSFCPWDDSFFIVYGKHAVLVCKIIKFVKPFIKTQVIPIEVIVKASSMPQLITPNPVPRSALSGTATARTGGSVPPSPHDDVPSLLFGLSAADLVNFLSEPDFAKDTTAEEEEPHSARDHAGGSDILNPANLAAHSRMPPSEGDEDSVTGEVDSRGLDMEDDDEFDIRQDSGRMDSNELGGNDTLTLSIARDHAGGSDILNPANLAAHSRMPPSEGDEDSVTGEVDSRGLDMEDDDEFDIRQDSGRMDSNELGGNDTLTLSMFKEARDYVSPFSFIDPLSPLPFSLKPPKHAIVSISWSSEEEEEKSKSVMYSCIIAVRSSESISPSMRLRRASINIESQRRASVLSDSHSSSEEEESMLLEQSPTMFLKLSIKNPMKHDRSKDDKSKQSRAKRGKGKSKATEVSTASNSVIPSLPPIVIVPFQLTIPHTRFPIFPLGVHVVDGVVVCVWRRDEEAERKRDEDDKRILEHTGEFGSNSGHRVSFEGFEKEYLPNANNGLSPSPSVHSTLSSGVPLPPRPLSNTPISILSYHDYQHPDHIITCRSVYGNIISTFSVIPKIETVLSLHRSNSLLYPLAESVCESEMWWVMVIERPRERLKCIGVLPSHHVSTNSEIDRAKLTDGHHDMDHSIHLQIDDLPQPGDRTLSHLDTPDSDIWYAFVSILHHSPIIEGTEDHYGIVCSEPCIAVKDHHPPIPASPSSSPTSGSSPLSSDTSSSQLLEQILLRSKGEERKMIEQSMLLGAGGRECVCISIDNVVMCGIITNKGVFLPCVNDIPRPCIPHPPPDSLMARARVASDSSPSPSRMMIMKPPTPPPLVCLSSSSSLFSLPPHIGNVTCMCSRGSTILVGTHKGYVVYLMVTQDDDADVISFHKQLSHAEKEGDGAEDDLPGMDIEGRREEGKFPSLNLRFVGSICVASTPIKCIGLGQHSSRVVVSTGGSDLSHAEKEGDGAEDDLPGMDIEGRREEGKFPSLNLRFVGSICVASTPIKCIGLGQHSSRVVVSTGGSDVLYLEMNEDVLESLWGDRRKQTESKTARSPRDSDIGDMSPPPPPNSLRPSLSMFSPFSLVGLCDLQSQIKKQHVIGIAVGREYVYVACDGDDGMVVRLNLNVPPPHGSPEAYKGCSFIPPSSSSIMLGSYSLAPQISRAHVPLSCISVCERRDVGWMSEWKERIPNADGTGFDKDSSESSIDCEEILVGTISGIVSIFRIRNSIGGVYGSSSERRNVIMNDSVSGVISGAPISPIVGMAPGSPEIASPALTVHALEGSTAASVISVRLDPETQIIGAVLADGKIVQGSYPPVDDDVEEGWRSKQQDIEAAREQLLEERDKMAEDLLCDAENELPHAVSEALTAFLQSVELRMMRERESGVRFLPLYGIEGRLYALAKLVELRKKMKRNELEEHEKRVEQERMTLMSSPSVSILHASCSSASLFSLQSLSVDPKRVPFQPHCTMLSCILTYEKRMQEKRPVSSTSGNSSSLQSAATINTSAATAVSSSFIRRRLDDIRQQADKLRDENESAPVSHQVPITSLFLDSDRLSEANESISIAVERKQRECQRAIVAAKLVQHKALEYTLDKCEDLECTTIYPLEQLHEEKSLSRSTSRSTLNPSASQATLTTHTSSAVLPHSQSASSLIAQSSGELSADNLPAVLCIPAPVNTASMRRERIRVKGLRFAEEALKEWERRREGGEECQTSLKTSMMSHLEDTKPEMTKSSYSVFSCLDSELPLFVGDMNYSTHMKDEIEEERKVRQEKKEAGTKTRTRMSSKKAAAAAAEREKEDALASASNAIAASFTSSSSSLFTSDPSILLASLIHSIIVNVQNGSPLESDTETDFFATVTSPALLSASSFLFTPFALLSECVLLSSISNLIKTTYGESFKSLFGKKLQVRQNLVSLVEKMKDCSHNIGVVNAHEHELSKRLQAVNTFVTLDLEEKTEERLDSIIGEQFKGPVLPIGSPQLPIISNEDKLEEKKISEQIVVSEEDVLRMGVEKVLTAEEQKLAEKKRQEELKKEQLKKGTEAGRRALMEMMNGSLAPTQDELLASKNLCIPRNILLRVVGTQSLPQQIKQQLQGWIEKMEKALSERVKARAGYESEYRKCVGRCKDIISEFNTSLVDLHKQRIGTLERCSECELAMECCLLSCCEILDHSYKSLPFSLFVDHYEELIVDTTEEIPRDVFCERKAVLEDDSTMKENEQLVKQISKQISKTKGEGYKERKQREEAERKEKERLKRKEEKEKQEKLRKERDKENAKATGGLKKKRKLRGKGESTGSLGKPGSVAAIDEDEEELVSLEPEGQLTSLDKGGKVEKRGKERRKVEAVMLTESYSSPIDTLSSLLCSLSLLCSPHDPYAFKTTMETVDKLLLNASSLQQNLSQNMSNIEAQNVALSKEKDRLDRKFKKLTQAGSELRAKLKNKSDVTLVSKIVQGLIRHVRERDGKVSVTEEELWTNSHDPSAVVPLPPLPLTLGMMCETAKVMYLPVSLGAKNRTEDECREIFVAALAPRADEVISGSTAKAYHVYIDLCRISVETWLLRNYENHAKTYKMSLNLLTDALRTLQQKGISMLADESKHRFSTLVDCARVVRIPQRQVEVDVEELRAVQDDVVVVKQTDIHSLNKRVFMAAQQRLKAAVLLCQANVNLRKLKWRLKRLQFEISKTTEETQEFQLERVTKVTQSLLEQVGGDVSAMHARETSKLKQQLTTSHHWNNVKQEDQKKRIANIIRSTEKLRRQTKTLKRRAIHEKEEVDQRKSVAVGMKEEKVVSHEARFQTVKDRANLKRVIHRHQLERDELLEEVERLRARVFPAFPNDDRLMDIDIRRKIMMKLYEEMKGKPSEEKKMDSSHSNSEIHLPCFPAIGCDNPFLSMGVSLLLSSYLCSMWTFIPLLSNLCLIDGMKQKIVNDLFNVFPYWAETIADVDGWDGEGQIMEMFTILMVNLALCKDNHPKLRPLQEIVLKIARSYKKLSIKERCVLFLNMIEE
ncbi:Cilia- and flagella-associated protein 43 like protein [Aduncisulcus paluster]|uniref:Cilia- and flagella-associated protein 43 like protein n=1 Tax=Aduncisulcus paluster TaxID=2918883 RepID=A0ABQ5K7B8_9EUKA|nr:Cilia- and flagella-associated protein 43 like protein [Aduncisulcus paluster]